MAATAVLLVLGVVLYLGWFAGRCWEADVADRIEAEEAAAYRYAAAHNKLPTRTVYVDTETGDELHGYNG